MPCPNCGYQVEVGTPICGNCGQPLGSYSTGTSLASRRSGPGRGLVLLFVVLILGGIIWGATNKIGDFFKSTDIGAITDAFDQFESGPDGFEIDKVPSPYRGVRAVAVALNKGGLRCNQIHVDHADDVVATGSCQVSGTHVQINIYFERTSLDAVENQMKDGAFTFVHDDNWFVFTLNPVARRVHKILGGKLSLTR